MIRPYSTPIVIISTEKMPVLVMFAIYLASPSCLSPHLFGIFVTSVCRLAPNNTFTEKSIIHSSGSDGLRVAGKSAVWWENFRSLFKEAVCSIPHHSGPLPPTDTSQSTEATDMAAACQMPKTLNFFTHVQCVRLLHSRTDKFLPKNSPPVLSSTPHAGYLHSLRSTLAEMMIQLAECRDRWVVQYNSESSCY